MLRKRPGGVLDCLTVTGSLSVSVLGGTEPAQSCFPRALAVLGPTGLHMASPRLLETGAKLRGPGPSCVGPSPPAWVLMVQGALVPHSLCCSCHLIPGPESSCSLSSVLEALIHSLPCHKRLNAHVGGCVLVL